MDVTVQRKTSLEPTPFTRTSVRWKNIASTLLVLWIVGMIDKIGVAVIATNKTFLADMNLIGQNAWIGSLVSVMMFSYGIGFFVWGWVVDFLGPRRSILLGVTGWGISTALAALSHNLPMLLFSRGLLGFAEAFLWPVSNSLTARWFPLSERGRAKSVWINGTNIGPALTGFITVALIGTFGWRGVFWFLTALAFLICLPMTYLLVFDDPAKLSRVSEGELRHIQGEQIRLHTSGDQTVRNVRKSLSYWLVVIGFTVNVLGVYGLATWFPSYLASAKHFNLATTSTYMLFAYGIALLITIWIGAHTDKTHRKAVWTVLGYSGAALLLVLTPQIDVPVMNAILVCGALTMLQGFTTPMEHGLMHSMSPTEEIGRNTGIMSGVANVIAAFGPTIMGALITLNHGSYSLAFYFLAIAFLVAAVCGVILQRQGY